MNWSSLARKYNITNRKGEIAKNGGQIAQDWVISQGENIHRSRSTEGLEFSRPGHLAVEMDSDFNPSVDCGVVI